jgi:hypothetical protein
MSPTESDTSAPPPFNARLFARVTAASFAALFVAGALMWWRFGPVIFLDVLTSLQNCF